MLKEMIVGDLASLNVKQITRQDMLDVASRYGTTVSVVQRAWKNLVELGEVDRRKTRGGREKGSAAKKLYVSKYMNEKLNSYPTQKLTPKVFRKMLKEYVNTDIKAIDLFKKHKINYQDFYRELRNFTVTGRIGNKVILDVNKYDKTDLSLVIRYIHKPDSKKLKDLSTAKRIQLARVATVLKQYL